MRVAAYWFEEAEKAIPKSSLPPDNPATSKAGT